VPWIFGDNLGQVVVVKTPAASVPARFSIKNVDDTTELFSTSCYLLSFSDFTFAVDYQLQKSLGGKIYYQEFGDRPVKVTIGGLAVGGTGFQTAVSHWNTYKAIGSAEPKKVRLYFVNASSRYALLVNSSFNFSIGENDLPLYSFTLTLVLLDTELSFS